MAVIFLPLLALVHQCIGSENVDALLKKRPSWSFEVESIESSIKNALHKHKLAGHDFELTEEMLRSDLKRSLAPGATHIPRKVGDPKWQQDPRNVPSTFDAREHWKACADIIGHVEDEGPCNTDVPAVVASVMSDRYCIYSNGTFKDRLSQEVMMGCGALCTGWPMSYYAWEYALNHGLPTGGPHGSNKGCAPYSYAGCNHTGYYDLTGSAQKMKSCQVPFDLECPTECTNKHYKTPLDKDLRNLTCFYFTSNDEFTMRNEIMTFGPIMSSVHFYNDFLEKPKGIFQRKENRKFLHGLKFFKIIGWGVEDGKKYWLCMHTWDTWGDKVFKFPRGENYDFIEWRPSAGLFDNMD
ncbi:unnamed protein product [Bemisia tabaci]|uniref:Peptidase C1A papain C-terminal domain-containing protein n=1 Tax=Bemisia tabaci TaxID=7038 RepID=A0A9P0AIZ5_BEMTA|nr:unnamed protein product [Bemisia tabaci]